MWILQPGICVHADYIGRLINCLKTETEDENY